MRLPKYISPSSLKTFEKDRAEFYLKYLADNKPPRMSQTRPMCVGSAFDAYVKSYLHNAIFGNYGVDDAYAKEKIFEAQVEEQNRDWARVAGQHVFDSYSKAGCLADIMFELSQCVGKPRFEFSIEDFVKSKIGNIPLLGKPDIFFTNKQGCRVILDWKVNGYCGNASTSPATGYIKVRDTWNGLHAKASRNNGNCHKDCIIKDHRGVKINGVIYMENVNGEWADQLAIYAWLLGEPIGSEDVVIGIDQIVGCGQSCIPDTNPDLRVANHRSRISRTYQLTLLGRLAYAWECIISGHYFKDLSLEDSKARCANIEAEATALADDSDPMGAFVNSVSREQ